MTLGNAKNLLLITIDDTTAKKDVISKLVPFFSIGQQKISQYYPVYKTVKYSVGEAMPLPTDFYKAVFVQMQSGAYINFTIENGKLNCKNNAAVKLVYEAKVNNIPTDASDDYILQIQDEAIMALIYYVAAQLNNNEDNAVAFQSYFAQHQGELQNLVQQPKIAPAIVIMGDDYV